MTWSRGPRPCPEWTGFRVQAFVGVVQPNFFDVIGVQPAVGGFVAEDFEGPRPLIEPRIITDEMFRGNRRLECIEPDGRAVRRSASRIGRPTRARPQEVRLPSAAAVRCRDARQRLDLIVARRQLLEIERIAVALPSTTAVSPGFKSSTSIPQAGGPLNPNASRGSGVALFDATTINRPVIGPRSDAGSIIANAISAVAGEGKAAEHIAAVIQKSSITNRFVTICLHAYLS